MKLLVSWIINAAFFPYTHTHTHTCTHRTITKLDFVLPLFLKAIMCHILFKILNMKAII